MDEDLASEQASRKTLRIVNRVFLTTIKMFSLIQPKTIFSDVYDSYDAFFSNFNHFNVSPKLK